MDATSPPSSHGGQAAGPRSSTSQRRWGLVAGLLLIPALLVVAGVPSAWPLVAIPIMISAPLLGGSGLAVAGAASGVTVALASGSPAVRGPELVVGLLAFLGASALAGVVLADGRSDADRGVDGALDRLTGLRSYGFFVDALPRECRRAARYDQRLSLVMLDLDGFKDFNDRHGHLAGNRLLAAIGRAMRADGRGSDLAARFGGEEFVVLVPGTVAEAGEAADRLRDAIASARIEVDDEMIGVSASAGVAEYDPDLDGDGQSLLARADAALYAAKRAGRNRTTVSDLREAA